MPIRSLLCLFLCVFASSPSLSKSNNTEKWYEIEIILFSNNNINNYDAELWEESPGFPKTRNTTTLYSEAELLLETLYQEDTAIIPKHLMTAEFDESNKDTLKRYVRRLEKSSKYELIFHHAWRQPLSKSAVFLTDKPDTSPIIFDDDTLSEEQIYEVSGGIVDEQTPEELLLSALLEEEKDFSQPLQHLPFFISEFDQIETLDDIRNAPVSKPTALSYEGPPLHMAYGNLILTKGRYLHMSLDFLYRGEPYTPTEPEVIPEVPAIVDNDSHQESLAFDEDALDDDIIAETEPTLAIEVTQEIKPPIPGYRIKDSKRVRLNRIYYFDHPLFGVIVRVIRHTPS